MSNKQFPQGLIDLHKPTVAVCTFYEEGFLHEGMWQFPIALASSDGYMAYLSVLVKPSSAKKLTDAQIVALKASIDTFRMLTDRYNVVCYGSKEVIKIIGDFFRPGTQVFCIKRQLAWVIGEYENGCLKTLTQKQASERIGLFVSEGPNPALNSAAWVLQACLWCLKKQLAKVSTFQ